MQLVRLSGTYSDGSSTFKLSTIGTNKIIMTDKSGKILSKGTYDGKSITMDGKTGTGSVLGITYADGSKWKKL